MSAAHDCKNAFQCDTISPDSTTQASAFLLVILSFLITGICLHFLRSFRSSINAQPFHKVLQSREIRHLYISYLIILPSLLMETLSLLYYNAIPEIQSKSPCPSCFADGSPIFLSESIDLVHHFIFCALCIMFVHFKIYHLFRTHFEYRSDQMHWHFEYRWDHGIEWMISIAVIMYTAVLSMVHILLLIPYRNNVNVFKYEQTAFFILGTVELIVIFAFFDYSKCSKLDNEVRDSLYLRRQWRALRVLLLMAWSGWGILYGIWMSVDTDYFYIRFCMLSLYGTWIAMWCYVDTKWLLQIVEKDEEQTKSPLSANEVIGSTFDMDSVLREIENGDSEDDSEDDPEDDPEDDQVVTASLDIEEYGGLKGMNEVELTEIVERRKREQKQATKGIEQILEQQLMAQSLSDSEELFVDQPGSPMSHSVTSGTKRNSRKTPRPPPRRKEKGISIEIGDEHKEIDSEDEDEDMYRNNVSYGIATDRGSSTKGDDDEKHQSNGNAMKSRNRKEMKLRNQKSTEYRQRENVRDWSSDSEQMYEDENENEVTQTSKTTLTVEGEECPD